MSQKLKEKQTTTTTNQKGPKYVHGHKGLMMK